MTPHALLGVAAGALELASAPVYIYSIIIGRSKPDRVTWWILAFVSGMIALTYYAAGARDTVWLPVAYSVCFSIVGIFSIWYGDGPARLSIIDRISVLTAVASIAVWRLMQSPITALSMNILSEFAGLMPTMVKAYNRPWTESRLPWIIGTIASFLNVLAVQQWSYVTAAYPLYIFATNTVIIGFLMRPIRR